MGRFTAALGALALAVGVVTGLPAQASSPAAAPEAVQAAAAAPTSVFLTSTATTPVNGKYLISVDVDPNLKGKKSWSYQLQRLVTATKKKKTTTAFKKVGNYKTQGAAETRNHKVVEGVYRTRIITGKGKKKKTSYSALLSVPVPAQAAAPAPTLTAPNPAASNMNNTTTGGGGTTNNGTTNGGGTGSGPGGGAPVTTTQTVAPTATVTATETTTTTAQPDPEILRRVPSAPTSVTVSADTRTSVTVSWAAPADDGGAPVLGYQVLQSNAGAGLAALGISGASTSYTFTGLDYNTDYAFVVQAQNRKGWSNLSAASPLYHAYTEPGSPTITGVVRYDRRAVISWTPPAAPRGDGGAAITGYTVTSSDGKTCAGAPDALSCEIGSQVSPLINTLPYSFTVKATNKAGDSLAAAAVNLQAASKPGAVTAVNLSVVGRTVTATWPAVSDGGIRPLQYRVSAGTQPVQTVDGTRATFVFTSGCTDCTVRVTAINPIGDGDFKRSEYFDLQ